MSDAVVAQKAPFPVELTEGQKYLANQSFILFQMIQVATLHHQFCEGR